MPQKTLLTATSALVMTLAVGPISAQESGQANAASGDAQTQDQTAQSGKNTGPAHETADGQSVDTASAADGSRPESNALVVTVGDTDILSSDVSRQISMLPPQIRQQPPAMLVPMAINQLIMRELIVQAAMTENLDEDPEVIALVDDAERASTQDAVVQVWLERALAERVTEEEVRAEYEEIKANTEQDLPPFKAVRAQIEQQLRQEAFAGLQENLREDVQITYYRPDGEPRTASSDNAAKNGD
ncbi:hypothetical protein [Roseivivax isoporae]|uniref:Peptidylprolyl isomerase n=1 Tax=Roseivivax isoporae LMG 25204 TaxID=1449351 RepID=X7F3Z7_9RHOB|nr:hypothetical protein [Roseivivax isoporae]ETX26826.1 hypothetical protein RISW2_18905 [Roseivivax isoporae LMG 25204]